MESNTIYYGVHVPSDIQVQDSDGSRNVFFDKLEALKEVKKYKKARFKAFQFYHEALEFALHGSEFPNNNSTLELNSKNNEVTHGVGEKPSQFRGPKSQDLVKLRKAIENGDYHYVKTTIWENPRYLISSGDTPAILQEGSRYNALHVAAKAKNAEMCDLILSTVGLPEFIQLLYGEENRSNSEEGSKILLDLYLNTPDKGLNETPLHFAVKFGAADVVEILVSYPQCDKTVLNKYSDMPKDMICSRIPNPSSALIERVSKLLDDRYYVPVLRSEDNCMQPIIGQPFSPNSPPVYQFIARAEPTNLNTNPIDPRMEIHAYAGPMKKEEANIFRKKWKTPPRIIASCVSPAKCPDIFGTPPNRSSSRFDLDLDFRLQDTEKGLERVGRDLAKKFNIGWKEYWSFLDTFTDLTKQEGLASLESFLKNRYVNSFSESMTNSINKRKNDSIGNSLNNLSSGLNSTIESPMTELCKNFEACSLSDKQQIETRSIKTTSTAQHLKHNEIFLDNLTRTGLSPCICIEKSCQVFANRLSYQMLYQMDEVTVQTLDLLETEIKHLKSVIASFMEDPTFSLINFQSVHSRIAYLISGKLKQTLTFDEELEEKIVNLEMIIQKYDKMVDLFSSDDEDLNSYRQPIRFVRRKSTSDSKQVLCLIEGILKSLECVSENEFTNVNTEEDCLRAWNNALPCACVWKTNKSSRRGSFAKKNTSKYFTKTPIVRMPQNKLLDGVSKRLNFLEDHCENNESFEYSEILSKQTSKDTTDSDVRYSGEDLSSSSDEEFITANNTPVSSAEDSCDESFEDVEINDLNVFIEGDLPTKMDYAVYTAVKDLQIDADEYPYIYRWRHSIKLFSEDARMSWPSPSCSRYGFNTYNVAMSTPRSDAKWSSVTPPHSWLRVTGQNSPMRSLKALRQCISLPYGENCYDS